MKAALFPGQGSQRTGMGERFYNAAPEAREVYAMASDVLGIDVAALCFRAPPQVLRSTKNAQIAVVVTSLAAEAVAASLGFTADIVAGHSVGEIAAAAAASSLDRADAVRAVAHRAALMAALPDGGVMAAIVGVPRDRLEQLCLEAAPLGRACVAVHNSDANTIVSGDAPAVEQVAARARTRGARVTMLGVSHAFHSPLVEPVLDDWARYLDTVPIRDPAVPVVSNVTAEPVVDAAGIRQSLVAQVVRPVRWRETLATLAAAGVDFAIELGDTKVLTSLSRQADPPLRTMSLADPRTLAVLRDERAALG